jgi:hypothetical protein
MGNSGKHTRLGLVALCAALELTGLEIGVPHTQLRAFLRHWSAVRNRRLASPRPEPRSP